MVLKVSFEPANLLAKNVTAYTNANWHVITYTYDSNGNVLTTTNANGAVTQVTYNSQNFPTMITDPEGKAAYALMQSIHNQAAGGAILYSALDNNCGQMSCYVLQAVGNDTPLDVNDSLITPASFLDAARQLSDWIMITDSSASKCN